MNCGIGLNHITQSSLVKEPSETESLPSRWHLLSDFHQSTGAKNSHPFGSRSTHRLSPMSFPFFRGSTTGGTYAMSVRSSFKIGNRQLLENLTASARVGYHILSQTCCQPLSSAFSHQRGAGNYHRVSIGIPGHWPCVLNRPREGVYINVLVSPVN